MGDIKVEKDTTIGIADILIFGAEILSEPASVMGEAEASTKVTLQSNGKRYLLKITVTEI